MPVRSKPKQSMKPAQPHHHPAVNSAPGRADWSARLAASLSTSLLIAACIVGCGRTDSTTTAPGADSTGKQLTIGVNFETLQTEYWVAGFEAIKAELKKRNIQIVESVADGDANRQLQQVRTFLTRKVDGIILVPKDAKTCIPAIKAANEAGIPIVLFNRPPLSRPA